MEIQQITPYPCSRSFVVGSTGSGKSTMAAALLQSYHRLHPTHPIYILDPKRRFAPVAPHEGETNPPLFPDGLKPQLIGRRKSVAVVGDMLDRPGRKRKGEPAYVVQDQAITSELFSYLYNEANARTPSLLYADESFDLMRGTRADPGFRRLLQQGRELGIGIIVVNQRPAWIDATFLSEAQFLYIGRINKVDDRKRIVEGVNDQNSAALFARPLQRYSWALVDQENERTIRFRLSL